MKREKFQQIGKIQHWKFQGGEQRMQRTSGNSTIGGKFHLENPAWPFLGSKYPQQGGCG